MTDIAPEPGAAQVALDGHSLVVGYTGYFWSVSLGGAIPVSTDNPLPVTVIGGSGGSGGPVTQGPAAAATAPWYVAPGTGVTFPVSGTFWQAAQPVVAPAAGNGTDASNATPATLTQLKSGTVTHPGQLYVQNQGAYTLQLWLQGASNPILIAPGSANAQGGDWQASANMPWFTGTYTINGASGAQFFANSN